MSKIVGLWNAVAFHLDHQISSLEDQLEGDFWDGPQKPESILHETQRASRRLRMYRGQLGSMRTDLVYHAGTAFPEDLVSDVKDIEEKLETLIQRADKAEQGLLATIAINEAVNASKLTAKASRLTAIALWFAPLSLSISLVSIDGDSKFGGKKYWIMALIAVPLLLLVMVLPVAKTSDMFMKALGKLRRPFLNARGLMTKVAGRLGKVTNPSAH